MSSVFSIFLAVSIVFLSSLSVSSSASASAGEIAKQCYWNAQNFVSLQAERTYDEDGFHAYGCFIAPNKKAVICEVSASKGDGAATDTYRVVMNLSCSKAYRVEMTGEE